MSFDEEHLDDHYLCQREVAERDQRIAALEAALTKIKDKGYEHPDPYVPGQWFADIAREALEASGE